MRTRVTKTWLRKRKQARSIRSTAPHSPRTVTSGFILATAKRMPEVVLGKRALGKEKKVTA